MALNNMYNFILALRDDKSDLRKENKFSRQTLAQVTGDMFANHACILFSQITPLHDSHANPIIMAQIYGHASLSTAQQMPDPIYAIGDIERRVRTSHTDVIDALPPCTSFAADMSEFLANFQVSPAAYNSGRSVRGITTIGTPILSPSYDIEVAPVSREYLLRFLSEIKK